MIVEIFSLCEAATQSDGNLNILGAFDCVFISQFPATCPPCAVAIRIRFDRIESGNHNLRLSFVDLDGKALVPNVEADFTVSMGGNRPSGVLNLVLNTPPFQFEEDGQYSLDLAIDGKREQSIPLFVSQAETTVIPPQIIAEN